MAIFFPRPPSNLDSTLQLHHKLFRELAGRVPPVWADRIVRHSTDRNRFPALGTIEVFDKREKLWGRLFNDILDSSVPVTYIEFGVWQGYSIKHMAELNTHPDSLFVGLDTFEGVDEQWVQFSMKDFDQNGQAPSTDDSRVVFLKGYFQHTIDQLASLVNGRSNFVVHFDADLYSSTLFALTQIDPWTDSYYAIFDEFHAGENLALANYMDSYLAKNELLGRTEDPRGLKVLSKITTRSDPSQS